MARKPDHLLRAIERAAARLPPGRVLDIPGASGRMHMALAPRGFRVVAGDLFRAQTSPIKGRIVQCDMGAPLPFRTASLDLAISSEGIEHVSDAFGFLRELARVVRPGGHLILTSPNPLNLRARVAFMLAGQLNLRSALDEVSCFHGRFDGRIMHGHAFLRSYFQFRYMLHHVGYRIRSIEWVRLSPTALLLTPLVPFVGMATARVYRLSARRYPGPHRREILRHVLSVPVLYSKNLCLVAERVAMPGS